MKQENQVCLLEQAKRLKELGIEQVGLFSINEYANQNSIEKTEDNDQPESSIGYFNGPLENFVHYVEYKGTYSAFTVSELQLMCGTMGNVEISEHNPTEGCFYSYYDKKFVYFKTLAAVFAAKLIRNLENEYYTAAEANERLKNG